MSGNPNKKPTPKEQQEFYDWLIRRDAGAGAPGVEAPEEELPSVMDVYRSLLREVEEEKEAARKGKNKKRVVIDLEKEITKENAKKQRRDAATAMAVCEADRRLSCHQGMTMGLTGGFEKGKNYDDTVEMINVDGKQEYDGATNEDIANFLWDSNRIRLTQIAVNLTPGNFTGPVPNTEKKKEKEVVKLANKLMVPNIRDDPNFLGVVIATNGIMQEEHPEYVGHIGFYSSSGAASDVYLGFTNEMLRNEAHGIVYAKELRDAVQSKMEKDAIPLPEQMKQPPSEFYLAHHVPLPEVQFFRGQIIDVGSEADDDAFEALVDTAEGDPDTLSEEQIERLIDIKRRKNPRFRWDNYANEKRRHGADIGGKK